MIFHSYVSLPEGTYGEGCGFLKRRHTGCCLETDADDCFRAAVAAASLCDCQGRLGWWTVDPAEGVM